MILIIRVRGRVGIKKDVEDTFQMLNLKRTNWATVVPEKPVYHGMIKKIKDFIAWGKIDRNFLKLLIEKRGEGKKDKISGKQLDKLFNGEKKLKDLGLKPYFRLHPPRKGYKHKKKPYVVGGVLGEWDNITELARRML